MSTQGPSPKPFASPGDPVATLLTQAEAQSRGAWVWPLLALGLIALAVGFLAWTSFHFNHLYGYWRAVREMELGALRVPPGQSLSFMLPIWIGLGTAAYTLAVAAMLRLWWLERRWRVLIRRTLGPGD